MLVLLFVLGFVAICIGTIGSIGYSKEYFPKILNKPYDENAQDLHCISNIIFLIGIFVVVGTLFAALIF